MSDDQIKLPYGVLHLARTEAGKILRGLGRLFEKQREI